MIRDYEDISGYDAMWLFVMFDLPVDTKTKRKQYAQFRKSLLKEGFTMLQYSVYARYTPSAESNTAQRKRLRDTIPPDGQVRIVNITDHQFGQMEVFFGKKRTPAEDPPTQLMLF